MILEALESLTPEALLSLTPEELAELNQAIKRYYESVMFRRMEDFKPFPYQSKFMNAGADYDVRFMRAANRIGKTFGGAMEMAYHVTGLYPDWWQGKRVEGSGRVYWCISRDLTMVKDIMQYELLGTTDIRLSEEVGTRAIPKEYILDSTKDGLEKDGGRVISIRVKHVSGGTNEIKFFGSENDHNSLMGRTIAGCWLDEGHANSVEIYSHCKTRVINALGPGHNGFIYITATPEDSGTARLSEMFEKDKSVFYLQSATWWDCPRFTEEQIQKELASLPEWQRDMRSKGLPVMGDFAVFQYDDRAISTDVINPQPHWRVCAGVDFGETTDPSVIIIALYDPDNDHYYIYKEFYIDTDIESRSAKNLAHILCNSEFSAVPVIVHSSDGIKSQNANANARVLSRYGANVYPVPFSNPPESQLKIKYTSNPNKSAQDIATGLGEMCLMMGEGRLKIKRDCVNWFNEKRTYYLKVNPKTYSVDYSGAEHCLDASRYALMSLQKGLGCYWSDRFNRNAIQFDSFETTQFNF